MSQYFGFELLFNSVKADLKHEPELLVIVCHWLLTRNEFLCVGKGPEKDVHSNETLSELLPAGWNEECGQYLLRYLRAGITPVMIVLDVTVDENKANISIAEVDSDTGEGLELMVNDYLSDFNLENNQKTTIQQMIPKVDELLFKFQNKFKQYMVSPNATVKPTQATTEPQKSAELPRQPAPEVYRDPLRIPPRRPEQNPFRDVGRNDLDPFYAGGGMLGGPFNRIPQPRFDPVQPDFDHFPVPGFNPLGGPRRNMFPDNDDMFT